MLFVISGKKRTGKDTAGKIMYINGIDGKVAFADTIKTTLESACYSLNESSFLRKFVNKNRMFWEGDREQSIPVSNAEVRQLFEKALEYLKDGHGFSMSIDTKLDLFRKLLDDNTEAWSIRRLMQVFGTDIVCSVDNRVWVTSAINKLFKFPGMDTVITDCRQEHEEKMMRQLGAKFIFLNKDTGLVDEHSTEQGLIPKDGDYVIDNNGTLDELETKLNEIIAHERSTKTNPAVN